MSGVREAALTPCAACPWRTDNHGRRHPDGWYTKANARRLWAKLRTGDGMTCHPTDPANTVSEAAQALGYRPAPEGSRPRQCAGAVILQQREAMALDAMADIKAYRRARPGGMTVDGLWAVVSGAIFAGTPLGPEKLALPDLNAPVSVPTTDLPWPLPEEGPCPA